MRIIKPPWNISRMSRPFISPASISHLYNNNLGSSNLAQTSCLQLAASSLSTTSKAKIQEEESKIKLVKLITTHGRNFQMSRRSAEALMEAGQVSLSGTIVTDKSYKLSLDDAFKGSIHVAGRKLLLPELQRSSSQKKGDEASNVVTRPSLPTIPTRVWIANKLAGELVSEHDPEGRPSFLDRLSRGGVGKPKRRKQGKAKSPAIHLKPIGRLDMMTEGLMLVTNDGIYARDMELPIHALHRTYRARVHGRVTPGKLHALRNGLDIDGTYYKGMKVNIELNKGRRAKGGNTNTWFIITCTQGKNRQIRRMLDHVGLKVTRLIRISFGDYDLNTIPSGLAIEVPVKRLETQKRKGELKMGIHKKGKSRGEENLSVDRATVEWVRHV